MPSVGSLLSRGVRATASCCAPSGDRGERHEAVTPPPAGVGVAAAGARRGHAVDVPAGRFRMGDESVWAYPGDGEGPVHDVRLDAFSIDAHAVTNDDFAAFVAATGHVGEAERYGW